MFRFQHIEYLIGLALIPILLILFLFLINWKKSRARRMGDPNLIRALTRGFSSLRFSLKFALATVALSALVVGIANLQKPGKTEHVSRKGVDVMIALDVSKSMLADDAKPNRLEKAKQFVNKLMQQLENDRVGLILFAGRAYLQMPLTTDHAAARMYIQSAGPSSVPSQGTVIGQALKIANSAFNSKERKFKAIVLVSDGEDHDPEALQMTEALSKNGIMLNTVGIGSPEGVPLIDYERNEIRKDAEGNPVITKLNEAELQQLARETKGIYVRLGDADEAARQIREQISTIEQRPLTDEAFTNYESYFQWFLAAAFLLLIIELMIPERKMTLT